MHIPDGFLTPAISALSLIISGPVIVYSLKKTRMGLDEKAVPLMALLTALFFAAQMMNYPVIGGTTAHFLGGASLALLLGPYAGCVSMTIIIVLQCLLFGDGGITALGANLLNMAVISVFIPTYIYSAVRKLGGGQTLGVVAGTFLGDVLAAVSAGVLLGLSTPVFQYGLEVAVPAMAINHSVIGAAEAIFTALLIQFLIKAKPEILTLSTPLNVSEVKIK